MSKINADIVIPSLPIPWSIVSAELEGLYGNTLLAEFQQIIKYYGIYENGADFTPESKNDFKASDLHFKESRKLINREARFLFSKHPDFWVTVPYDKNSEDEKVKEIALEQTTLLQKYIDNVFEDTNFYSKLVKAAKDCFIGKRVAYFVNFNEVTQKITVDFIPSLGFVFETDENDTNKLTKIITFYIIKDNQVKKEQRIYKKKYWLEQNDVCWIEESIYDGTGELIETVTPARATKFIGVIPAGVIVNDGLTGDLDGVSEIADLEDSESWFSRISNGDIDSERCGMNPIRWARDMNPTTTKNLSIAPGAFWDMASDPNAPDGVTGEVGMMETSLNYTNAVNSTLSRIRSSMFESLDIPDVSADALKGVVSSGKTLKAIYWSLIVRCDEKMLAWRPALTQIVKFIIEGGKLYPQSTKSYINEPIPQTEYQIEVDNQYPLPDDEADEKQIDLAEVNAQTMSKMSYMKKWRNLTDAEAMQELKQIALERELLEDSAGYLPPTDQTIQEEEENAIEEDLEPLDEEAEAQAEQEELSALDKEEAADLAEIENFDDDDILLALDNLEAQLK